MLTHWIDKGRDALSRLAQGLGEHAPGNANTSHSARLARAALCVQLPSFRQLLPYETVDSDGLFINKQSVGFGLHVLPAAGADEALVKSMAELIKSHLHAGVDCTVILHKHPYIGAELCQGFESMMSKGGIYERLSRMSLNYHLKAIRQGYQNGCNIPAQLADYRCYLFFSMKKNASAQSAMGLVRSHVESELKVAGLAHARIGRADFITWMRTLVSPEANSINWPVVSDDVDLPLSHAIPSAFMMSIGDLSLDIDTSDINGVPERTRIVNCQIERWPDTFALWQSPDLFANLLAPSEGLPCPFIISFTIRGVQQERVMAHAKMRAKSLNANANAVQEFINPGMQDEASSWNFIHEEGSRDNLALLPTFYNLMLFTTEAQEREMVAKAKAAYRKMSFELQQSCGTQWVRYLASLPFFITEGFGKDLNFMGLMKQMTHHSIANLMPIVADMKGSRSGMLLPTHRHQMAFLDTFDDVNLPIANFNFLTVGSSGAGKSMFQQALAFSGLSLGEMTYVIDLGDSYKHLCEIVGGTYIDVSNMVLNPFTLFDFDGKTALQGPDGLSQEINDSVQIRDLLAIMASPNVPVCEIQKSYLLDAACACWQAFGKKACMDDVLEALRARGEKPESKNDIRLYDLVVLLEKYGTNGIYGRMFNGETQAIHQSKLVVFEMRGLEENPDLLKIVMFVMIVIIQGQFYQTARDIKKRCIIDEAWRFLTKGSNPIAAQFIEQGFRTARKHNGGFGVITQHLNDTAGSIQGQAIAASSDLKIILRQGNFQDYLNKNPQRFTPLQEKMIASFGAVSGTGFSNVMLEAGEETVSFHRYFADPYSRVLFSSKGVEFERVKGLVESGVPLEEAVHQVTIEFYGEGV